MVRTEQDAAAALSELGTMRTASRSDEKAGLFAPNLLWRRGALGFYRALVRPFRGRGLHRIRPLARIYQGLYWRLASGEVLVDVQDSRMYLDLRQSDLARRLYLSGIADPAETAIMRRVLRQGMVFVDVGANIGYYSLLSARLVGPTGRVYAFEPDPWCYDLLCRSVDVNDYRQVVASPCAVAGGRGSVWLSQPRNRSMQQITRDPASGGCIAVQAVSLDQAFGGISHGIDLLKIDVEGGEPQVLRGMRETIRRNPHLQIITEFNPRALREMGENPDEYLRDLEVEGFTLHAISEGNGLLRRMDRAAVLSQCQQGMWMNLFCERTDHA